ncbi:pyocin activator PrtN family protein [Edaphovirga cremea]|uniref:pyocin activator PrtN family protein n=1 Tax=Edaphovirga cremea TaxID=2267246 RepID=UPI003989AF05
MNILFLMMAQFQGQDVIRISQVCTDYMGLTAEKFKMKCLSGEINIPIIHLGAESQKAAFGVHLANLENYTDRQRTKAKSDNNKLMER